VHTHRALAAVLLQAGLVATAHGVQVAATPAALSQLSLEELGQIEISSVSRRPERVEDAAAAVYVITREQIARSGATTLAEALRLAPNLQVARVTSSSYAVSARGFSSESANKLLVMIDGRSVYTPLHSGVFWDAQDTLLADIDRIEVARDPAETLWGANAVNGVINIVTRSAQDTAGTYVGALAGNDDRSLSLRHGVRLGDGPGAAAVRGLRAALPRRRDAACRRHAGERRLEPLAGWLPQRRQRVDGGMDAARRRLRRPLEHADHA
jgi:iron complex outermembrane receptor protein